MHGRGGTSAGPSHLRSPLRATHLRVSMRSLSCVPNALLDTALLGHAASWLRTIWPCTCAGRQQREGWEGAGQREWSSGVLLYAGNS